MNKEAVREQLKIDEGWRSHAYRDHLGYLTIGYGFLVDESRGGGMPESVGEYWLDTEIEDRWQKLCRGIPWIEGQPDEVQNALLNMSYQLGLGGLLEFHKMLGALQSGDRQTAADEAMNSLWGTQTPERAGRISAMIRGAPDPASSQ